MYALAPMGLSGLGKLKLRRLADPAGLFKKKKKKSKPARAVAQSVAAPVAAQVTAAIAPTAQAMPAAASVPASVPITAAPVFRSPPQEFFAPSTEEKARPMFSPKWIAVGGAVALALLVLPRLMKGRA